MRYVATLLIIFWGWYGWAADPFYLSVGGFEACENPKTHQSAFYRQCRYQERKRLDYFLKKEAPNVNAITLWVTRDWQPGWYPPHQVNQFVQSGYQPIFIFYWFADDISPRFVQSHKKAYLDALERMIVYLRKIHGPKWIVLNPEFNENGICKSRDFDLLQAQVILRLKEALPEVKVGPCLGDFGQHDKVWDPLNWSACDRAMKLSAQLSDFIAFQEMRALTKDPKEEIVNTAKRSLGFATYLHQHFKKPTLLAYLAISSYQDEALQKAVFSEMAKLLPLMRQSAGLIGLGLFHYIDIPTHQGFFQEGEKYFGIKRSDGSPKPSFEEFLKF